MKYVVYMINEYFKFSSETWQNSPFCLYCQALTLIQQPMIIWLNCKSVIIIEIQRGIRNLIARKA